MSTFRVYKQGVFPSPKKQFYKEEFESRKKAISFCENNQEKNLTIVWPNGLEEKYH